MININRLVQSIEELALIGKTPSGGVTRYAYTQIEQQANEYVKQLMEASGLTTYYDAIGNLIGQYEGCESLPSIVLGSHIDTVPEGGKFDGALGVLTAIEVVATFIEKQIKLKHPIKIIAFKDEEGARFQFGMIGSRAAAGTLQDGDLNRVDDTGITLKEAMYNQCFSPHLMTDAILKDVKCYLELHIEQGKVLEKANASVGIVSGIAGPLWKEYKIVGTAEHAGATPMSMRKDPLVAASQIIVKIEEMARQYANAVATVGKIQVLPNGINVIPDEVAFTVDIRDIDIEIRDKLEQQIEDFVKMTVKERKLSYQVQVLQRVPSVPCDNSIQTAIHQAMVKLELSPITLPSGAGHDAMQFHNLFPIGMIFICSKEGISHNPKEYSSPLHIKDGANVLFETLLTLDQV